MNETDSSNLRRAEIIINKYGYPGKSLVGFPANETIYYIIQHSTEISKYLSVVKKAAKEGEIPYKLYAQMLDRHLMYKGRKQLYGTQIKGGLRIIGIEGQQEWVTIVWPIKKYRFVNRRRKEAGFPDTVEDNAKRLGVQYKHFSIKQVEKIFNLNKFPKNRYD